MTRLLLLASCALLVGCANYKTRAVDLTKATENSELAGMPFTLNKPQFTITRIPGGADAADRYTLTPNYVPDPTQRFAVSIHPSVLSSVDWTLAWDEGGSLTDSNGKFTDQSVAVLASVVKLAGAAAAFDSNEVPQTTSVQYIDARLTKNAVSATPMIYDPVSQDLVAASSADVQWLSQAWAQMKAQLEDLANQGRLNAFTYQDIGERRVLLTALYLSKPDAIAKRPDLTAYKASVDPAITKEAIAKRPYAFQVLAAYDDLDLARLNAIKAGAVKAQSRAAADLRQMGAPKAKFDSNATIKLQASVVAMAANAIDAVTVSPNDRLFALAKLPLAEWQARRVNELNQAIGERQAALRGTAAASIPSTGDIERDDPALIVLQRRKATVLGMLDAFDQAEALRRVSSQDPEAFANAQETRTSLLKRLAEAEAALVIAAATPKADDAVIAEWLQASEKDAPDDLWIQARTMGMPLYVVVTRPAPPLSKPPPPPVAGQGATAVPTPNDASASAPKKDAQ